LRDIIKMIVVLTVISTVMGATLSLVESITREPIKFSKIKFVKGPAVVAVLPECENDPIQDYKEGVVLEEKAGQKIIKSIFPARKNGKCVAVAFEVTGQGFHGPLGIMIGVDLKTGKLTGMRVMTHTETPGLGARATEPAFYKQFSGLGIKDVVLSDQGGKVDAITGATITSQGVLGAVKAGLQLFSRSKDKIMGAVGAG